MVSRFGGAEYEVKPGVLVSEMEVATVAEFDRLMGGGGQSSEDAREFENIMKGITISSITAAARSTRSRDDTA